MGLKDFLKKLVVGEPVKKESTKVDPSSLKVEREFFTKVVGVTFGNDDGSSRQEIISKCKEGDDVIFRPISMKGHPEAIGVFTAGGKQLGFLDAELATELREKYPMNPMSSTIGNITGGHDGKNYGCNLRIVIYRR